MTATPTRRRPDRTPRTTLDPVPLFLNTTAGARATGRMHRLEELVRAEHAATRIHALARGEDLTALVREAVAAGARRIAVAGGDGSMRAAAQAIGFPP